MHSLTIVFGPSPVPWILLYRDEIKAADAYMHLQTRNGDPSLANPFVTLMDDFGQQVAIGIKSIHGIMLEDMDQSKLAHIEQGLHRARTQAKAQELAAADPVLKVAAMRQGPAMLQPGFGGPGNGAFRGQ